MNIEMKLRVAEIQRFCMHDGPGIRTTVFLKGCPLRCEWCHNPEGQNAKPEILFYKDKCIGCGRCAKVCRTGAHEEETFDREKCVVCGECAKECPTGALELCGKDMSVEEILDVAMRDLAFYGENGGVTLSGGEPLMQKNAVALLKACRERDIRAAVETCGYVSEDVLCAAIPYTDLFLWDVKDTDGERHEKHTGVPVAKILENLELASEAGARIRLRCIIINGINTDEEHYRRLAAIARSVKCLDGIDVIPYHAYAGSKATFLGRPDNGRREWIPDAEQISLAERIVKGEI